MTQLPYRIKPGYAGIVVELPQDSVVVDVGFGGDPVKGATWYIDRDLTESIDRNGEIAAEVPKEKFIRCDIDKSDIPLPDKSCDFVVASHIAEHVATPEHLCGEMQRIGKAGYIETPGFVQELLKNYPQHRWYVTKILGNLVFIRKPEIIRNHRWIIPEWPPIVIVAYLFRQTCYRWKDKVKCVVIG
jgi:hypothetical protein